MKNWSRPEKIAFIAFLLWCAAGLIFTLLRITPDSFAHNSSAPRWLIQFIDLCLQTGDPILILLAFINTHLHAARQWTPNSARRWMLIILACSLAVETLGALTGFPFGAYSYTNHFGPMLGAVPLTIPLAWHVVVTNALFVSRRVLPHSSRLTEAALAGLLCTLYDFILEPFATSVKAYWIWSGGSIPLQNYVAWFILSGLLVWFFAPTSASRFRRDLRPWIILGLTVLIFLAGRWSHLR